MPGFNRTGPMGAGPMTGGARGLCNPATAGTMPAYGGGYGRGPGFGRGFRRGYGPDAGRGRGFGRGYGWYPAAVVPPYAMSASDEIEMLKADADSLQQSLDAIHNRMAELEKKSAESA